MTTEGPTPPPEPYGKKQPLVPAVWRRWRSGIAAHRGAMLLVVLLVAVHLTVNWRFGWEGDVAKVLIRGVLIVLVADVFTVRSRLTEPFQIVRPLSYATLAVGVLMIASGIHGSGAFAEEGAMSFRANSYLFLPIAAVFVMSHFRGVTWTSLGFSLRGVHTIAPLLVVGALTFTWRFEGWVEQLEMASPEEQRMWLMWFLTNTLWIVGSIPLMYVVLTRVTVHSGSRAAGIHAVGLLALGAEIAWTVAQPIDGELAGILRTSTFAPGPVFVNEALGTYLGGLVTGYLLHRTDSAVPAMSAGVFLG